MRVAYPIAFALVLASAACSVDETCADDSDCFAGETCNLGLCGQDSPNGADNSGTADGGSSSTNSANGATNAMSADAANNASTPDASTPNASTPDASTPNASTPDASTPDASTPDMAALCTASPFDVSCGDDGNDSFAETIEPSTRGCLPDDESFKSLDKTITGLLCALETRDKYSTIYAECRAKSFVTEVRLTPLQDCDPADIDFEVSMQGKSCANQGDSPDITCTVEPDGSFLARIVVRPSSVPSLGSLRIDLESTRENVHFDYDLQVVMRE